MQRLLAVAFFFIQSLLAAASSEPELVGSHYKITICASDGYRILDRIFQVAQNHNIKDKNVFVCWDFDDTVAVRKNDGYFAHLARVGLFREQVTYGTFRTVAFDLFKLAGFPEVGLEGLNRQTRESLGWFLENMDVFPLFFKSYNELSVEAKDKIATVIDVAMTIVKPEKSDDQYILKDQCVKVAMDSLNKLGVAMAICSNDEETPEKRTIVGDIPWYSSKGIDRDNKAPSVYHAFREGKKKSALRGRPKSLIVLIDDKEGVFDQHAVDKPQNSITFLINWKRFEAHGDKLVSLEEIETIMNEIKTLAFHKNIL